MWVNRCFKVGFLEELNRNIVIVNYEKRKTPMEEMRKAAHPGIRLKKNYFPRGALKQQCTQQKGS